jgi:hypothetical protein
VPKTTESELEARQRQRVDARERLLAKKPRVAEVVICLDDDLALEHDRALDHLQQAKDAKNADDIARLTARVDQLAAELAEATTVIKVRAMGGREYDALVDAHPPTKAQEDDAKKRGGSAPYNPDTFSPALIAASVAEPELSLEDAQHIWDTWNVGERLALFYAALDVNSRAQRVADVGKGYGETRA